MLKLKCLTFVIFCLQTAHLSANGWLDWVPSKDKLEYCDTKLTDILGATALATTAVAAMGSSVTTTSITPAVFLIAGESSLMLTTGTTISVVSTPVVGTAAAVGASIASVAYGGGKAVCKLSDFLEAKYVTNEPIPLVMNFKDYKWGVNDKEGYESGQYKFVKTDKIIPAGTPVLGFRQISEDAAAHYPDYQGRGLVQLGQFFAKGYFSDIPEDQRGFAVVPANSLNPIFIEKYTHLFLEDTLVEQNGEKIMLPAGTPFQLLKVREDGWAKFELVDGFNLWVEQFYNVKTLKIEEVGISKLDQ